MNKMRCALCGAVGARRVVVLPALALACVAAAEPRTYDGSENNLDNPQWGSTGEQLGRIAPPNYADGVSEMVGPPQWPNPRVVSNAVAHQDSMSGVFIPDPRGLTDYIWAWGQFLDHDISKTPAESTPAFIPIPAGDPWFDPDGDGDAILPFRRSNFDPSTGTDLDNPRQQITGITAWLDASNVYASSVERGEWLRTFAGDGKLKTTDHPTGPLLPFNDGTQDNDGGSGNDTTFFVAGDTRANETLTLISLHTLFVREHNRLAEELAQQHPDWTGDQIYHQSRKIVGGLIQSITFNEYLPALLGAGSIPSYPGYDDALPPAIISSFSTAAFRMGHTQVSPIILRLDETGETIPQGNAELQHSFFEPQRIPEQGGIDPILRGLSASLAQQVDAKIIDDLRNFLFAQPGEVPPPLDLATLNLQRGRDHGLPDYNTLRQAYGLPPAQDFSDITSDAQAVAALEEVYGEVNGAHPWIAMLAEDHVPGASVGETIFTIVQEQFLRLREADRFWYQFDPELDDWESWLNQQRLRDVILRNTPIQPEDLQPNVFFLPCPADLNGDDQVDGADLGLLLGQWNSDASSADLNGDDVVDRADLGLLLGAWGPCF